MPLETANFITQLDSANPASPDPISDGDNHIRLIKQVIKNCLPLVDGPINLKPHEFGVPSGTIIPFAGSSVPNGWLLCYGQSIPTADYPNLYTAIGNTYGGGPTNFNVPDLRGRFVLGKDNMGGTAAGRVTGAGSNLDATLLANVGGSQFLQSHNHPIADPGHYHGVVTFAGGSDQVIARDTSVSGGGFNITGGGPVNGYTTSGMETVVTPTGVTVVNNGSGNSQNIPPCIVLNYLIKT